MCRNYFNIKSLNMLNLISVLVECFPQTMFRTADSLFLMVKQLMTILHTVFFVQKKFFSVFQTLFFFNKNAE